VPLALEIDEIVVRCGSQEVILSFTGRTFEATAFGLASEREEEVPFEMAAQPVRIRTADQIAPDFQPLNRVGKSKQLATTFCRRCRHRRDKASFGRQRGVLGGPIPLVPSTR